MNKKNTEDLEALVVAIKHECRNDAPEDWREQIEKLEGVEIVGDKKAMAIRVQGPKGINKKLSEAVGQYCHIEPVIYSFHVQDE